MVGLNSQRETRAINREQCDHFLTRWLHKTLQMFAGIDSSADSVDSSPVGETLMVLLAYITILYITSGIFLMFSNTGGEDRQKNLVLVKPNFSATSLQECSMVA